MAGIELEAFWELERLGCLKANEFYLPGKAEDSYYSKRLHHSKDLIKQRGGKTFRPTVRK